MTSTMEYTEPLPDNCPPEDAIEIKDAIVVFRLVKTNPPSSGDFISQRAEYPKKIFSDIPECIARGLSVWIDLEACRKAGLLPTQKGRQICKVFLVDGAGKILQTFKLNHRTWWSFRSYDILSHCELLAS